MAPETLTIPGLDAPVTRRTRGDRPAITPQDRPDLLARLLGERDATATAVAAPASAPVAVAVVAEPVPDVPAAAVAAGATLDDLLVGTWEGLMSGAAVACPVCDAPDGLAPRYSAGARPVGGRCGCGSTLA